jgi:hypothetical protein
VKDRTLPLVAVFFIVAAVTAVLVYHARRPLRRDADTTEIPELRLPNSEPATSAPTPPDKGSSRTSPLLAHIEALLARFKSGAASAADLAALKTELLAADPALAIAAIRDFLASGGDARTGVDFAIKAGGEITAPSLRVMLMDTLGQIARATGSDAAAKLARETLQKKDSADEWAIALRNIAWHEPQNTALLASKMREMLASQPWRAAPTSGMLEAFDVIVFTKDASLVPDLASAQADPNEQLRHAADVALDRLAAASPLDVMSYLNSHPDTLADRPMLRADYFAKADLGQPGQKSAVELYLGRPDVADAEKSKLLKALATPASFISENLLTPPPSEIDESAREHAILFALHEWLTQKRYPSLTPQLLDLQRRLARE